MFRLLLLSSLATLFSTHAVASSGNSLGLTQLASTQLASAQIVAGWIEFISIPEMQAMVKAKLDTGAKTSSIHAENIESFKREGKRWVRFDLVFDHQEPESEAKKSKKKSAAQSVLRKTFEKPRVRGVKIKNHDGDHDSRAVVELDFCFDGRLHKAEFTLADRSQYIYPVLIGRRFLDGTAIVDSSTTFEATPGCVSQI